MSDQAGSGTIQPKAVQPNAVRPPSEVSTRAAALVGRLRGRLVVSCQAPPGHPLAAGSSIALLCRCALEGGAAGLRVEGLEAVALVKRASDVPVIGLRKVYSSGIRLRGDRPAITPTVSDARALAGAGADIVSIEATRDLHGAGLEAHVAAVSSTLRVPVMADVSTLEEGLAAVAAGASFVGTTLSGYTSSSQDLPGPDLDLVASLAERGVPVVAEGRIGSPAEAVAALGRGALFLVVGKAISDPLARTQEFVAALARPDGDA